MLKQSCVLRANSLFTISDSGDDEEKSCDHNQPHDYSKHYQPHREWLLKRGRQCRYNAYELQGLVIQPERIINSPSAQPENITSGCGEIFWCAGEGVKD